MSDKFIGAPKKTTTHVNQDENFRSVYETRCEA